MIRVMLAVHLNRSLQALVVQIICCYICKHTPRNQLCPSAVSLELQLLAIIYRVILKLHQGNICHNGSHLRHGDVCWVSNVDARNVPLLPNLNHRGISAQILDVFDDLFTNRCYTQSIRAVVFAKLIF